MIAEVRGARRDEVAQAARRLAVVLDRLLPQEVEPLADLLAPVVGVELDVVAHAVRRKEAVDATRREQLLLDDGVEERVPLGEDLAGLLAVLLVLEDARVDPLELPGVEEGRPVDVLAQGRQRDVGQDAHAGEAAATARPRRAT